MIPMQHSLTQGPITKNILLFALPLMFGNLLQQMYNIADTWVVGRFLGADALAAVGSSYTLMTFLTSILLGLCMGSGAAVSMQYGSGETEKMRQSVFQSFLLIAGIALVLNLLVYLGLNGILWLLRVPAELCPLMKDYLLIIFLGITATFLYNYFANLLRAIGNSVVPLAFLAVSAILNVILDLVCVLVLDWGVKGAAVATVFSQYVSGVGIGLYTLKKFPQLCPKRTDCRWDRKNLANILNLSVMTSVQQSIMNFGILMVQGLVNSFGTVIMAAFAAAVKIDSFAYMPVQDFGNAFSTYVAQNYGAGQPDRIKKGICSAGLTSAVFCIVISVLVCAFAAPLMGIFIDPAQTEIIAAGVQYLRIEGACYIGIGVLFLLYGYYRAVNQPGMSVILTIASLGTRVALAYLLSATPLGVTGIWLSVPIGWALADAIGIGYYLKKSACKNDEAMVR
ncbi:MATE family efflux transporter [Faecalibacterium prausnitzii]|uniref:MATE family efflux transporter n=1 Tax=Faecalibacterium prausnitzii TaxID=853 RepID=UPI0039896F0F